MSHKLVNYCSIIFCLIAVRALNPGDRGCVTEARHVSTSYVCTDIPLKVLHIYSLIYACGCIHGCTAVYDHLEIVCIKILVWCPDAGAVENLMH